MAFFCCKNFYLSKGVDGYKFYVFKKEDALVMYSFKEQCFLHIKTKIPISNCMWCAKVLPSTIPKSWFQNSNNKNFPTIVCTELKDLVMI